VDGDGGSELRGRPHPCSTFHRNYTLKDTYYIVELATLCTVVHIISSFFCYTYLLSGQLSLWTFRIWEGVGRTNVTTVDRGSKKSEILRTSQMEGRRPRLSPQGPSEKGGPNGCPTEHLRNAADNLAKMRLNFKTVKEEAISACITSITWGVAPCFADKRRTKRKRHFDELADDSRLSDPEDCFRVNVFYKMLDIASNQITQRFAAMTTVVQKFAALNPVNLTRLDEHEIVEAATRLQEEYSDDLSEAFAMQLVSFKASLKTDIEKLSSIKQLAHMLIVECSGVAVPHQHAVLGPEKVKLKY
jgi:hypothetical protein